ncbi:hypothetical protein CO134_02845 [Candidatus Kuenenbacteria bacterium CG_4_9_14_3_um_filter_39_14]|uniref:Restriction endonuclease n=7 Tax=Candidatus Kueneniibacteriota TaxID=1752740 RepID=A0A2M7IL70_9BACT|nr:MAG: hypothetical protein AUK13_02265 [Candidatus Kuenenbacteria bacterium CG2_30_39_24]PIP28892.1 MAG: hypothetical protein COX28_02215 [Candidatus Kuenenbacteria bacterium CG23_combo_of_CG06-09_8_20_14_all_39_39]PIP75229.1 MAG: hypothetical protein COW86_04940 [Candidatus Kuenenbacteria bacterium CG22_combo_CG10-13_8_21_14_all_39_9]PIR80824.1 MAG: hypothetical protein COU24_01885 [Candidatus Kuenenbacteria bacterium CG10_big_fil_rev_8_21_14_0_10_39_14]PIW95576.1 MAG: hypothetical protein C
MYKYHHPKPIVVKLTDELGFRLRQKAAEYIAANQNRTGAERGSSEEQGFGALAEMVIRNKLGMPEINPEDHPLGYDLLLPSSVKVDVKCRGGALPFKEEYESNDGIAREAKHNFFARQINDENLDTDIYVMTHLETPSNRELPGTTRQRKWILYICGWVSKERVSNEGVYLPRGSLTEQGRTWFTYRGQEIELYNRNLNGLGEVEDLLSIESTDVEKDKKHKGDLNLTSVDAVRITYDPIGRGVLSEKHLAFIQKEIGLNRIVKPILHSNQYFHLLNWLKGKGALTDSEVEKARKIFQEEPYSGI